MNKNQIVVAAVTTGVCVHSIVKYQKIRREEMKKREEIAANTARSIHAIQLGSQRIQTRLMNGEYMPASVAALRTDLEFEYIVAYNE